MSETKNSVDTNDDLYFTTDYKSEMNAKMRISDSNSLFEHFDVPRRIASADIKSMMFVPDRILVAGDNRHIAVKETMPELQFDTGLPIPKPNYSLTAPPSVLTIDKYPYPSVEFETPPKPTPKPASLLDQSLRTVDMNESVMSSSCAPEEEVAILRRQVRNLSRRILTIEQENQQRQQREIILYALGVTYFFLKGLLWLHRHF